jgi:hypothetical protein
VPATLLNHATKAEKLFGGGALLSSYSDRLCMIRVLFFMNIDKKDTHPKYMHQEGYSSR